MKIDNPSLPMATSTTSESGVLAVPTALVFLPSVRLSIDMSIHSNVTQQSTEFRAEVLAKYDMITLPFNIGTLCCSALLYKLPILSYKLV